MTINAENNPIIPFHLLIPAAGSARRMAHETPKPYLKVNGKTILRHTIEKFINIKGLESVLVVINPEHRDLYNDAVQGLDLMLPIDGSNSRKSSIYNGLNNLSNVVTSNTILIHDAARPMVDEQDIYKLLNKMQKADAATLACPVTDTLYRDNKTVSRDNLWAIQTPQAFRFGALMDAHECYKDDDNFTDDAGLMRAAGHHVEIVPSSRANIKITTQEDLEIAKTLMNDTTETRTASGFDVHAFETKASTRKLILGGVEIPHHAALTGHSDADVVLHALTDALFGVINEGDIGTHFPPSEAQWKDASSDIFLEKAVQNLTHKGGILNFVDITIMAEEPKIGPHREKMQNRIAEICDICPSRVSIKATTTEQLGFTGRKEGMACQALATVTLPIL